MKTYSAHLGIRIEKYDQTIPAPDYVCVVQTKPWRRPSAAIGQLVAETMGRVDVALGDPTMEESAQGLLREAAHVLMDAAGELATWPAFAVLEDSDDAYGKVTGRLWLTVTEWADDVSRLERGPDGD